MTSPHLGDTGNSGDATDRTTDLWPPDGSPRPVHPEGIADTVTEQGAPALEVHATGGGSNLLVTLSVLLPLPLLVVVFLVTDLGDEPAMWLVLGALVLSALVAMTVLWNAQRRRPVRWAFADDGIRTVTRAGAETVPWTSIAAITLVDEVRGAGRYQQRVRALELEREDGQPPLPVSRVSRDADADLDALAHLAATWYARGWLTDRVAYRENTPATRRV